MRVEVVCRRRLLTSHTSRRWVATAKCRETLTAPPLCETFDNLYCVFDLPRDATKPRNVLILYVSTALFAIMQYGNFLKRQLHKSPCTARQSFGCFGVEDVSKLKLAERQSTSKFTRRFILCGFCFFFSFRRCVPEFVRAVFPLQQICSNIIHTSDIVNCGVSIMRQ